MRREVMRFFLFSLEIIFFCLLLVFSLAKINHASRTTPCDTIVNSDLCWSILNNFSNSSVDRDQLDYAKFSLEYSLKQAQNLSKILRGYLNEKGWPPIKPGQNPIKLDFEPMEVLALENCSHLATLNVECIKSILAELRKHEDNDYDYDRVETLLSNLLSNQNTCYGQIMKTFSSPNRTGKNNNNGVMRNTVQFLISDATRVYGTSQGLVTHALENLKQINNTSLLEFDNNGDKSVSKQQQIGSVNRLPLDGLIQNQRIIIHNSEVQRSGVLVRGVISVGQSTHDNFTSISEAISSAPSNLKAEDGYFVIYVREGVYNEYVTIPRDKTNIMILGDGIGRTVITGNRNAVDGWNTYDSATFSVLGDRFIAINVTFRNTAGPTKFQAVAVMNRANLSTFYRCSFEGYQDTLYAYSMTQFYRECDIYGTVDFIFGDATAVFQNCNIYVRRPIQGQFNAITAQGRLDNASNTGFSIHNCTIDAAPDLAENLNFASSFLGRPWQKYARVVVMESYVGKAINQNGWCEWDGNFALDTLFYGEYKNFGPGADTLGRIHWRGYKVMDAIQAAKFTVHNFTDGGAWLPTGVPFSPGLIS